MAGPNRITKVAIVGANGNIGKYITAALLKTGTHTVTAITRTNSQSNFSEGVSSKSIDYSKPETLVDALKGQDALIITLSGGAPKGTEEQLIRAAGEASVPWILPSDFTPDTANKVLTKGVPVFEARVAIHKVIEDLGKSSYISFVTGFWYEYCLAMPMAFGFDFAEKAATLFDEGETDVSFSTLPQVGRAVAALLSLPVEAEGAKDAPCLEALRIKWYTNEEDWTISKEPAQERIAAGIAESNDGKRAGFAKMFFTKVFVPGMGGDFEHTKGTMNGLLGLPKDNLDEATRDAIERSKKPQWTAEK